MVNTAKTFNMADIMRFPSISRQFFIECSGNGLTEWKKPYLKPVQGTHGLTSTTEWTGVPLSTLLREVGVKDGAGWILAEGGDVAGIMHSEGEATLPARDLLERYWSGPVAVYPNSGRYTRPHWYFDSLIEPDKFAAAAMQWAQRDVKAIGGCCGLGPEHISELSKALGRMP